eukprot:g14187.t1
MVLSLRGEKECLPCARGDYCPGCDAYQKCPGTQRLSYALRKVVDMRPRNRCPCGRPHFSSRIWGVLWRHACNETELSNCLLDGCPADLHDGDECDRLKCRMQCAKEQGPDCVKAFAELCEEMTIGTGTAAIVISSSTTTPSSSFDVWRSVAFGLFGAIYAGGPGYVIYNLVYPRFPGLFLRRPLLGSAFDSVVQTPLVFMMGPAMVLPWPTGIGLNTIAGPAIVFFPVFYVVKEAIGRADHMQQHSNEHLLAAARRKYWQNFVVDNTAACAVWIPLQYVNFRFM